MLYSRYIYLLSLLLLPYAKARGGVQSSPYDPPSGYYSAAEGLVGTSLKAVLHQRIRGHRVLGYGSSGTVPALRVLDAMPGDPSQVRLLYWGAGRSAVNYGGNNGQWNHEHCWPQSYGVASGPGNTDLFNLRPCDVQANAERGNLFYAEITAGNVPVFAPFCRKTVTQWMPLPTEKGDIARAMFYMDVRYEGGETTPNLELSDVPNGNTFGRLNDLLRWHREDPVDDSEKRRNYLIYTDYQLNRNPFVDDPDYAEMIFKGVPVVRVTAVQSTATEGENPVVVRISRRGPLQNPLTVVLSYGGTAETAAWVVVPPSVTIPAGASDYDLSLSPRPHSGQQGVRNFTVEAVTNATYAPLDAPAEVFLLDGGAPSSFSVWSGGQLPTEALLTAYAVGGASGPTSNNGMAVISEVTSSNLSITAIIRTNDLSLVVQGECITGLGQGGWITNGVVVTTNAVDQTGVPEGCQRQIFTAPSNSERTKFFRLRSTLQN